MSGQSGVVCKGVRRCQKMLLLGAFDQMRGKNVAVRSILKHLTVNSYRKCIKCMDQTEIRRLLPAAQRLFEQLLNSSQALSILFRLEYFSNLTIQAWIVFKPHYSGHYSWIVTYSRHSLMLDWGSPHFGQVCGVWVPLWIPQEPQPSSLSDQWIPIQPKPGMLSKPL